MAYIAFLPAAWLSGLLFGIALWRGEIGPFRPASTAQANAFLGSALRILKILVVVSFLFAVMSIFIYISVVFAADASAMRQGASS